MITFKLCFTTGQTFIIKEHSNKIFKSVLNEFLAKQNMEKTIIKAAVCNANPIDMNQTLLFNKIINNSIVMLYVEQIIKSQPNNINNNNIYNNYYKKPSLMNLPTNLLNTKNTFSTPNIFNTTNNLKYNNTFNNNINNINYLSNKNVQQYAPPLITVNNPQPIIPNINLNNNINNNITSNLKKEIDILINGCYVPPHIFDSRGDCVNNWETGRKNGPPGYLKDYIPPIGWTGIGLKVLNLYDNGDNRWLGTTNHVGEWYIAYHGIKTLNSIAGIIYNGFRRGPYQACKNERNLNPLNNNFYQICGEGVYFIPDFNDVKQNTNILNYSGINFRVIFMCRINPYKVRICRYGNNKEAWIVNGDRLNDTYGKKYDDEVRLYRILIYIDNI